MHDNCEFCKLLQGKSSSVDQEYFDKRTFYRNRYWVCLLDMNPLTSGHTILINKHSTLSHTLEADENSYRALYRAIKRCQKKLNLLNLGFKKLTLHSMNELGRKDPRLGHLHFHLVPVYEFTEADSKE